MFRPIANSFASLCFSNVKKNDGDKHTGEMLHGKKSICTFHRGAPSLLLDDLITPGSKKPKRKADQQLQVCKDDHD